jgi:catechol 2,3-dioxygenase-like lactoylglutathione lyase family enzyme
MIHHLAIAVKDVRKSHHFYTHVMGFKTVTAVKRKVPGGGWTKHIFYDMGNGSFFAIWDVKGILGVQLDPNWTSSISKGLGLPSWMNHIAFQCSGPEELEERKQRWLDNGYHVTVVEHDFIKSCYTYDPDGNWVEWTYATRSLTQADRIEAEQILADDSPATRSDYEGVVFRTTVKKYDPDAVPDSR